MKKVVIGLVCAGAIGLAASTTTQAFGHHLFFWKPRPRPAAWLHRDRSFQRIGTFANYLNNPDIGDETVSEITAATANGRLLVYTDSPMGEIGFIDISNPSHPQPGGKLALDPNPADDIDYEPTSVDILGNKYALVAVNSSESYTNTSGELVVVDLQGTPTIVRRIDLGGQPDSIKISPDHRFAAIVIENERDETICAGGAADGDEIVDDDDYEGDPGTTTEDLCEDVGGVIGGLPQTPYGNPAGYLVIVELTGPNPLGWTRHDVDLTGLAGYAPEDPEPEFVDVNRHNQAVVSLQENNHIVIVDLPSHTIVDDFPAGTVDLSGVDNDEDGVIALTDAIAGVPREPDAIAWVPGAFGRERIGTANEGDLFGGSRGFSLFEPDGSLFYDSGSSYEQIAVQHGHYPEDRSENKGSEPESIEYGRFGGTDYLFVGSERGSFVAVYELDRFGRPEFVQLLPAPSGPEGLLAIPSRGLLVASGENDDPSYGVRSTVMIYRLRRGEPTYPQIMSDDGGGSPIPWSALSGMTAIPGQYDSVLAVWDSYYSESRIFRIDVSEKPAVITDALTINDNGIGSGDYDPEGISVAPDGALWVASEGNASDSRPNRLLKVDPDTGNVLAEVGLPAEILACRAASSATATLGSGFEGVAVLRDGFWSDGYKLLVAQQRGWDYTTPECEDLDDDDGGLDANGQPLRSRIWVYDPASGEWDHAAWELQPLSTHASWVGLSEITVTPWREVILIERDNRTGDFGELKTLVEVRLGAADDRLIENDEKAVFNLRPRLTATNGWITDKPEGVAVLPNGKLFVVTDNDGVEDWSGETWFLDLGWYWWLFR